MFKIAEIKPKGVAKMVVYYDRHADRNPYRVYLEWKEQTPHGLANRRKMINRYADLFSEAAEMNQYAFQHNEERR